MLQSIRVLIISIMVSGFMFADVLITEIADPNNNTNARYLELYNSGEAVVVLDGMTLQRWTNGNADPTSTTNLSGNLVPGGFFIVCKSTSEFSTVYGMDCDMSGGSPADSNGDDQIALFAADGTLADFFGVAGEDGTGTWHEFEDGRVERNADQMNGCMD